jgi:hypothetical protein
MNKYQKTTSTISRDKKLQLSSHPLKAIQANTTTTILPHNLKFKQEPKCFEITKMLKENVDTTTTVSSQTSSHLKSKGNSKNINRFFTLRENVCPGTRLIYLFP